MEEIKEHTSKAEIAQDDDSSKSKDASKMTPAFQDKEERRLIIMSSMDNLLKIHEVERNEKHNTLKFYAVFLGGGLTLVFGMAKFSFGIVSAMLEIVALAVIITINFLAIKKLISVRGASNNIYHEYGKRLRYLLSNYSSDIEKGSQEEKELDGAFKKYIDEQKLGEFLPRHSADKYEIYGFYYINILFSFIFIIPLASIYRYFGCFDEKTTIVQQVCSHTSGYFFGCIFQIVIFQLIISLIVWWIGKYIIDTAPKSPNIGNNK